MTDFVLPPLTEEELASVNRLLDSVALPGPDSKRISYNVQVKLGQAQPVVESGDTPQPPEE
jgi:hypothetical protein